MNQPFAAEFVRLGPRPLPVHVAAVTAQHGGDPAFPARLAAMMAGVAAYQKHPFRRSMPALQEVWRTGEVSVLRCAPAHTAECCSLFLVPSMINRSAILDLLPGKSFVRWLAAQGCDVYMLDWGQPVADAGLQDIAGVTARIVRAARAVAEIKGGAVQALGYCMGGTLLAQAALQAPEVIGASVFLASPWDFHAGDQALAGQIRNGAPSALQMIEAGGSLPADWIQAVFATVNADRAVEKFSGFTALDPESEKAQLFVAVEDWLNDGIAMPGGVAKTCITEWYGHNRVGVDLAGLTGPALVVASGSDRLVPSESSLAMAAILPQCDVIKPAIGHIGMMTGRTAEKDVWAPVLGWLKLQSPLA